MADRLWRMPVAPEMYVFEREVGGDHDLMIGRRAKNGAVVADAEAKRTAPIRDSGANGPNQRLLPDVGFRVIWLVFGGLPVRGRHTA